MSDEPANSGDTEERKREKEGAERESEERQTEQGAPADRAGRADPAEESTLGSVPGQAGGRSD